MRCLNAERAERGGGCSADHTSGEKVEDELEASASFGGNDLNEERWTEANFAAVETSRRRGWLIGFGQSVWRSSSRVAVSRTDHVTGGEGTRACLEQVGINTFLLSKLPSQWPSPHSGNEQKTEDHLPQQIFPLTMMRMVTLNKTLYVAFSSLLSQKHVVLIFQSLGCSHSARIALGDPRNEHDCRLCSYRPRICTTLLQNQSPRPSSVRAAHILLPSTSSLTNTHHSFDEVHFGKFAAHYITREYYFDVHPPFAKLLFGLAGWFVGFDGQFNFENIGDSYTENHVPYVGMRLLPAILGSLTIPIVYGIMKESGYGTVIAAFSASIVLFGMC